MSEDVMHREGLRESKKSKKKILIVIAVILLLLIAGGLYYWKYYQDTQKIKNYKSNLSLVTVQIMAVGMTAEDMVNTYQTIWHDAIFEDSYTTSDGNTQYYKSFNNGIQEQKEIYENDGSIEKLNEGMDKVDATMEKLKEPPEQYKDIYKEVVDSYSTLNRFVSMAKDPSGSLQSYTDDASEMDTELVKKIDSIRVQLPK